MKELHYAYKITGQLAGLACTYAEIEEDKMLDLLKDIQKQDREGIYWIFKKRNDLPKEPLCIIDCQHQRIYYHHSGEVDTIEDVVKKLTK